MLVDYDIEREQKKDSFIPFIQFVLMILFIQCLVYLLPDWMTSSATEVDEDTLRFRVIANSNSDVDQQLKAEVLAEIEPLMIQALQSEDIQSSLVEIEEELLQKATAIANAEGETVTFGRERALFPPKLLGATLYPQNYYDAYVLTIGSGRGDNFWCALFPNVCYPEPKEEEQVEEKPKFFVWEWLQKVFS